VISGNGSIGEGDVMVVPPSSDVPLPQPNSAAITPQRDAASPRQPSAASAARQPSAVAPPRRVAGQRAELDVDAQVPAYAALVRRHNPRLNDSQADEIATALVTHGYAHNIDPRFLAAVVCVESGFNPYALSSSARWD
jgi:soluble lytic murein transglycosylase-like protein